jgi:phage FluMu protein Com
MPPPEQNDRNKVAVTPKQETSLRCGCGSLLARVVPNGVELKCRRCKRQVIIPFDTRSGVRIRM